MTANEALTWTLGVVGLGCSLAIGARLLLDHATEKMHREFERRFPGECSVCSYHRYGVQHGHVEPSAPPPAHECQRVQQRREECIAAEVVNE